MTQRDEYVNPTDPRGPDGPTRTTERAPPSGPASAQFRPPRHHPSRCTYTLKEAPMPSFRSLATTGLIALAVVIAYQKYGDKLPIGH
jgi:hypothetical protein